MENMLEIVKEELIFRGLKLDDMGYELNEITDDVGLFSEETPGADTLALDSLDGLQLIVGIEKRFGFKFGDIDKETFRRLNTPMSIVGLISERVGSVAC